MSEDPTELAQVLDLRVLDQRSLIQVDLDQEAAPAVVLTFGSSVVVLIPFVVDDGHAGFDLEAFYAGAPMTDPDDRTHKLIQHTFPR